MLADPVLRPREGASPSMLSLSVSVLSLVVDEIASVEVYPRNEHMLQSTEAIWEGKVPYSPFFFLFFLARMGQKKAIVTQ